MTAITCTMTATSSLTVTNLADAKPLGVRIMGNEPRPIIGFKPPPMPQQGQTYSVVIVDMWGNRQAELDGALLGPIKWSITDKGSFDFSVPIDHPKVEEVQVPEREVQVWRKGQLLWWGVIVRARADGKQVNFQCQTVEWYFDRRIMGPIPRTGHFEKGSHFEYGIGMWNLSFLPGSEPAVKPVASLSSEFAIAGGNSMMISASGGRKKYTNSADDWFTTTTGDTLTAAGKSAIEAMQAETFGSVPRITVKVYHDNTLDWKTANTITQARADAIAAWFQRSPGGKPDARVTTIGMGKKDPVATNTTAAGRAENRRTVVSFRDSDSKKGHQQYASQSIEVTNPIQMKGRLRCTFRAWVYIEEFDAPAANNWGLVIERQSKTKPSKNPALAAAGYKRVFARRFVPINKETPRNRWVRMEASVHVPNDGKTYVIEGRLFPPSGKAYFDEADIYTDDALNYVNEEQADMLRDLIDHAQDETLGKTPLNIDYSIQDTGVKRTRRYSYAERTVIGDHLNEFTTLGDGMEWDIQITPTTRTFTTYYPRKERFTDYVLALGRNVVDFDVEVDGLMTANQVVVMANDVEAYAREERSYSDLSLIEGISMEIAYMATPGSAISSLKSQARRGLERYRKPTTVPVVRTNPDHVDELVHEVQTGDVVDVDVRSGWFQAVTKYRVLDRTLDPKTEQFSYTLMPEDTPIQMLADWGSQWKFFSQAQSATTGTGNSVPKETNTEYAAKTFDDSGWATGTAGFGWFIDGSQVSQQPNLTPATTIPNEHEVWIRKTVLCTEEMYVATRADRFAYVYVNGNLIRERHFVGRNFDGGFVAGKARVPQEYLDPSGVQVVAVHVQAKLSQRPTHPTALYADAKVFGIYDLNHVE